MKKGGRKVYGMPPLNWRKVSGDCMPQGDWVGIDSGRDGISTRGRPSPLPPSGTRQCPAKGTRGPPLGFPQPLVPPSPGARHRLWS